MPVTYCFYYRLPLSLYASIFLLSKLFHPICARFAYLSAPRIGSIQTRVAPPRNSNRARCVVRRNAWRREPDRPLCDHEGMSVEANAATAVATITRRAADRLRGGHLWIYRSDVDRLSGSDIPGGALVSVADSRGIPLGTAIYSAGSEIALRLVSRQPGLGRAEYLADLRTRLHAALRLRESVAAEAFSPSADNNACRLIFSEADDLPGIIADRYAGLVVVQLLTQGTAQDDVRAALAEVLAEQPWVHTVVERPDPRMRELELLGPPPETPLFVRAGEPSLQTIFAINGLRFHFDATAGQKIPRSAPELRRCRKPRAAIRQDGPRARRLHLPGRVRTASRKHLRSRHRRRRQPRRARSRRPQS